MKYEYTEIDLNDIPRKSNAIAVLNAAGQERWRLVYVAPNLQAMMIREIEEEPAPEPENKTVARRKK